MRNWSWLALGALALAVCGSPAFADADAKKGKKVFKKCKACHMVGEKAKKRVGPPLNDLFGRKAGGLDGFKYSKVMVGLGEAGLVWNEETLSEYLESPKKWLKAKAPELGLKCEDLSASSLPHWGNPRIIRQVAPRSRSTVSGKKTRPIPCQWNSV